MNANPPPSSGTAPAFHGKVAHVMRRFVPGKWGGTESVVFNLARSYIQNGIESPVFCTDMFAHPGLDPFHGVPIHRFRYVFPWLFLGEEARAKLRLKGGSPLSFGLFRASCANRDSRSFTPTPSTGSAGSRAPWRACGAFPMSSASTAAI